LASRELPAACGQRDKHTADIRRGF
jgi:hypothetical protein